MYKKNFDYFKFSGADSSNNYEKTHHTHDLEKLNEERNEDDLENMMDDDLENMKMG